MALSQDDINRVNEEIKDSSVYRWFIVLFDILSKPLRDWLDRKFGK